VGDALRQAKSAYFNRTGIHSFTPYDEKVLSEMTLYGLPMLRLQFPNTGPLQGPRWLVAGEQMESQLATRHLISDVTGLTAQRVTFDLPLASQTITDGTYFHVNDEVEVVAGMPIMPRTSVSVTLPAEPIPPGGTLALPGEQARGAFFEGGYYRTYTPFDPMIARLITDTAVGRVEPPYAFEEWVPAAWDLVNSVQTPEGLRQRLVILPAQYSASSAVTGTMRVFDTMTYTVYYSDTEDRMPPSFWLVEDATVGNSQHITVEVTDQSDIKRVAAGYTWGDGRWDVVDMARSTANPNIWSGAVPYTETLAYFVQAVDGAGNVEVETNKAWYFTCHQDERYDTYLPLVLRGY